MTGVLSLDQTKPKRTNGRFYGGLVFAVLVILLAIKGDMWLGDVLSRNDMLPVRAVEIDGAFTQLSRKEIADLAGRITANKNIAKLNLETLQNTLEQIPWVAQVAIKKKMPDTLIISVVEHVPATYWNEKGLYDARTESIFYPDLRYFSQPLVHLGGFRDNLAPDVYESAVVFLKALQNTPYNMYGLYLDQVRCYTLTLDNGTKLILGRKEQDALKRLERFVRSFSQTGLKIDEVSYVDLRYDVGFAVGKKEANSKESTSKVN